MALFLERRALVEVDGFRQHWGPLLGYLLQDPSGQWYRVPVRNRIPILDVDELEPVDVVYLPDPQYAPCKLGQMPPHPPPHAGGLVVSGDTHTTSGCWCIDEPGATAKSSPDDVPPPPTPVAPRPHKDNCSHRKVKLSCCGVIVPQHKCMETYLLWQLSNHSRRRNC